MDIHGNSDWLKGRDPPVSGGSQVKMSFLRRIMTLSLSLSGKAALTQAALKTGEGYSGKECIN